MFVLVSYDDNFIDLWLVVPKRLFVLICIFLWITLSQINDFYASFHPKNRYISQCKNVPEGQIQTGLVPKALNQTRVLFSFNPYARHGQQQSTFTCQKNNLFFTNSISNILTWPTHVLSRRTGVLCIYSYSQTSA